MEVMKNIYRNMSYPVTFSLSSSTKKINISWIRDNSWTEQMSHMLPSLTLKIITDSKVFSAVIDDYSCYNAVVVLDSDNYILQVEPNYDNYVIRNHNDMVSNGIINDSMWSNDVDIFPCTLEINDLDNYITFENIDNDSIQLNGNGKLSANINIFDSKGNLNTTNSNVIGGSSNCSIVSGKDNKITSAFRTFISGTSNTSNNVEDSVIVGKNNKVYSTGRSIISGYGNYVTDVNGCIVCGDNATTKNNNNTLKFVIGNGGSSSNPSNALTIDKFGNVATQGDLIYNSDKSLTQVISDIVSRLDNIESVIGNNENILPSLP